MLNTLALITYLPDPLANFPRLFLPDPLCSHRSLVALPFTPQKSP